MDVFEVDCGRSTATGPCHFITKTKQHWLSEVEVAMNALLVLFWINRTASSANKLESHRSESLMFKRGTAQALSQLEREGGGSNGETGNNTPVRERVNASFSTESRFSCPMVVCRPFSSARPAGCLCSAPSV